MRCDKEFRTSPAKIKEGKGKYCSLSCFSASRPQQVTCHCAICGKELKRLLSRNKGIENIFCSRECQGKWRTAFLKGENAPNWNGGSLIKTCENCGTSFTVVRSVSELGKGRFCSQKCYWASLSEAMAGDKNYFWQGAEINKNCEICNKPFKTFECHVKAGHGRFCSKDCYNIWNIGINTPNWQGGKSFEPYPPTFNKIFKEKIRQRDNYTCILCNQHGKDVHHIDYNKDNTTPENCITLCRKCHGKTNTNRDYWQKLLSANLESVES